MLYACPSQARLRRLHIHVCARTRCARICCTCPRHPRPSHARPRCAHDVLNNNYCHSNILTDATVSWPGIFPDLLYSDIANAGISPKNGSVATVAVVWNRFLGDMPIFKWKNTKSLLHCCIVHANYKMAPEKDILEEISIERHRFFPQLILAGRSLSG
jgi:hypothetical protein